jgi:hypothetical protein
MYPTAASTQNEDPEHRIAPAKEALNSVFTASNALGLLFDALTLAWRLMHIMFEGAAWLAQF